MNTPDPTQQQPIPFYRSAVLRGLLAAVFSQVLARVAAQYHINFALFGVDANSLASWTLDAISGIAIYYAAHARVTKPLPPVTFTKPKDPTP